MLTPRSGVMLVAEHMAHTDKTKKKSILEGISSRCYLVKKFNKKYEVDNLHGSYRGGGFGS